MNHNTKIFTYGLIASTALLGACGGSSGGGGGDAATPVADAVALIAEGVEVTGSSLGGSRMASQSNSFRVSPLSVLPFTSSLCDSNGMPDGYNQSDVEYPFISTYCGFTVNAGDTVRGGFGLAQSLICSLEKGGIEFAGATQSITPDFDDTECWPDGAPGGDETPDGIVMSAVGSSPASFNSYFDKGVVFAVDELGLEFKIAANLDGDKIEFIAHENWVSGDSSGNQGVMAGSIDKDTGALQFEKRDERIRADCADSSCGWNRHTRLYASLDMVDGEPQNLNSFSYVNSDTHVADLTDPVATTSQGTLITAQGALAGEIQARTYGVATATVAQIKDPSEWTLQHVADACADASGINNGGACDSEMGIEKFATTTKFAMVSTPAHTTPATWLADFGGFNFTSVDVEADVAYDTK